MKTLYFSRSVLAVTAAAALLAAQAVAQEAPGPAPVQLSYGVSQIVQLAKANVSDNTIISYIHNSGSSYGLDANQILYLKQQGVSDNVINTMLNQPRQLAQATPPQNYPAATSDQTATVVTQPPVASVPSSTVYVIPDTQTYQYYNSPYYNSPYYYGYYPYYGWYPGLSLSFGFGGGYRGGYYHGGWGGGYRGGYHGGGGGGHHH